MRTGFRRHQQLLIGLGLALLICVPTPAHAAPQIELYGTFHAMGIIVTLDPTDDPDSDAVATVTYRDRNGAYQTGFPLSRIAVDRFVGSLFWLNPNTTYDVDVRLSDPDGGPLNGVLIGSWATTRAEIAIPTPIHEYVVHPTGTGTACTTGAPCSLTEAISQARAGEAVVLRGGTYYTGGIDLPRSGQPGAPIIIRSATGETAVLDGADPNVLTWADAGSGVYSATANAASIHLVLADGKRLFPYQSLNDLRGRIWDNTPGFYQDGTTVYVHLANGAHPAAATLVVSHQNVAFTVEQNHIDFLNLTFAHYGRGSYAKAIYLNNASDNLVQGCTFTDNDLGVGIKRDSHRNVIQDSIFTETIFDWPWDGIKDVGGLENGGVVFYDPTTGRGNVIRRNTFRDDFDGMVACPATTAGLTNETDVYDNLIHRMGDDGISTDGQCSNVRIWGNTFHDVLMGISLAPVYDGPVYAIRNLIYRTGVGNNNYTGSPFKFNSGYAQSGHIYLFHNTTDAALPGNNGLYIKSPGSWRLIYARNNIWAGTDYAIHNYNTSQPLDMDYDNLYNAGANDLVRWDNARYPTVPEFFAATHQEANGLNVSPGFRNAGSGIYTLDPSSDLVDAGIPIPGINNDYAGSAPDIGAFENNTGNQAPVAMDDTAVTAVGTALTINLIANDRDAENDALSISTCTSVSANGGTITPQNATDVRYEPAATFSGTDTFAYTATDGTDQSNTGTVTVTVQAPGSPGATTGGGSGGGCFIDNLVQ